MDQSTRAGFTLVECLLVLAIAAILSGVAIPGLQGRERRIARLDAVAALTRLQAAQERYRSQFGLYAPDLTALQGISPKSPQGRYALSLASTGAQTYRAQAQALGDQARDTDCPALMLDVNEGFAHFGPSAACWGR
jgi:type IV pilus assembly protein PilE